MSFSDTQGFKVFKWVFIVFCLGSVLWFTSFQEKFHLYQRDVFEKNDFVNYYQKELSNFEQVVSFSSGRVGKMQLAGFNEDNQTFDLMIKDDRISASTRRKDLHFVVFKGFEYETYHQNKDEIVSKTLTVDRKGFSPKTFQKFWRYKLQEVKMEQIPPSVIEYLGTSPKQLADFLGHIKKLNTSVEIYGDSIFFPIHHQQHGHYRILHTTKPVITNFEEHDDSQTLPIVGKLSEHVYWIRDN